jgi:lipopolysaccharide cholinephosphotransferase
MEFNTYNADDNSELRKLQLTILDIIKLFARICEKHNLRYYMVGGTMLGAIRHKGFIPWDDDVDMGMPRPDYEKFLKIVKKELPEGYSFLNYKSNPKYNRYFSRIVNDNVEIYNNSNSVEIVENAWLDIFPYDGMPNSAFGQKVHFWYTTCWRLLYHMSCFDELVNLNRPGRPKYQQCIINFLRVTKLGRNLDTHKIMYKIEKKLCKYNYDSSNTVVSFFGAYMTKEIIDKRILGELKYYPFEDTKFLGAEHYDEFLTHYYGAWKNPPSDSNKDKHSIRKIVYKE